jgi:hypothetical protein
VQKEAGYHFMPKLRVEGESSVERARRDLHMKPPFPNTTPGEDVCVCMCVCVCWDVSRQFKTQKEKLAFGPSFYQGAPELGYNCNHQNLFVLPLSSSFSVSGKPGAESWVDIRRRNDVGNHKEAKTIPTPSHTLQDFKPVLDLMKEKSEIRGRFEVNNMGLQGRCERNYFSFLTPF